MRKILSIIFVFVLAVLPLSACSNNVVRDYSHYFGLCEVSCDAIPEVERSLTNEFIADMSGAIGVQSFRIWMSVSDVIIREDYSNKLSVNKAKAEVYHDLIAKLKAKGVTRFLAMSEGWIYPFDYPVTTRSCVPDPEEEYNVYMQFLQLLEESYSLLSAEFPDIDYFEVGNEPDNDGGNFLHKNGYTFGGSVQVNAEFLYPASELAYIIPDMCWYAGRGARKGNSDAKILLPGLCNYVTTPEFLDGIYNAIESKCLPMGEKYADINPDNYFQILNWHPYVLVGAGDLGDEWVAHQKAIYQVAKNHKDGDKPVWFTEMGWSDKGVAEKEDTIAKRYLDLFDKTKNELEFIETIFIFRISTLAETKISDNEDNFGIIISPLDKLRAGEPKAAAIAITKYIKGENCDLTPLYAYVPAGNGGK